MTIHTVPEEQLREKFLSVREALAALSNASLPDVPDVPLHPVRTRYEVRKLLASGDPVAFFATQSDREGAVAQRVREGFVELRDVASGQASGVQRDEQRAVWNSLARPETRFTRGNRVLATPDRFLVPDVLIDQRGRFTRPAASDMRQLTTFLKELSLLPIHVSPDRFSDHAVRELGLAELLDPQGEGRTAAEFFNLVVRGSPMVSLRLKKMLELAELLDGRNQRILVLRSSVNHPLANEINATYSNVADPSPEVCGTIVYLRETQGDKRQQWPADGKPPYSTLEWQHFSSLYAAHRKTIHQHSGYVDEIRIVAELQHQLTTMQGRVAGWRRDTPEVDKQAIVRDLNKVLAEGIENLQWCINTPKVEVASLMGAMINLRDSTDRVNPSVGVARIIAALNRLNRRMIEISSKGGYGEQDQTVLWQQLVIHTGVLGEIFARIDRRLPDITASRRIFNGTVLTDTQLEGDVVDAMRKIRLDGIEQIRIRPFTSFAERLMQFHAEAQTALEARNWNNFAHVGIKLHVLARYYRALECFEALKERLAVGGAGFVNLLHVVNGRIGGIRVERPVAFADTTYRDYDSARNHVIGLVETMVERLSQYAEQTNLSPNQVNAAYKRLKRFLDANDPEIQVRGFK